MGMSKVCRVCCGVYEVDGVRKWYNYACSTTSYICLTRCDEVSRCLQCSHPRKAGPVYSSHHVGTCWSQVAW